MAPNSEEYSDIVRSWWESLPDSARRVRGNVAGALMLLDRLRSELEFDIGFHKASSSDQLRNATGKNLKTILARHGEDRTFLKEAGRTNRGLMQNMELLLTTLAGSGITELAEDELSAAIDEMQSYLVERVQNFLDSAKISFDYRASMSSREIVAGIIDTASKRQKAGDVAEYLVGAKLALRFPSYDIRNSAASAADVQTDEHGDFQINDCVFHVTVAPNSGHYEKCRSNVDNGLRVFVLVPDDSLMGTRQNVQNIEGALGDRVSVESIESFVSQNIEELSEFASSKVATNLRLLLEKYNERVAEVETDLSLQITIPAALNG